MNFVYFILVLYFNIKNEKSGKYKNIKYGQWAPQKEC